MKILEFQDNLQQEKLRMQEGLNNYFLNLWNGW
jgi:hypothetical protein